MYFFMQNKGGGAKKIICNFFCLHPVMPIRDKKLQFRFEITIPVAR